MNSRLESFWRLSRTFETGHIPFNFRFDRDCLCAHVYKGCNNEGWLNLKWHVWGNLIISVLIPWRKSSLCLLPFYVTCTNSRWYYAAVDCNNRFSPMWLVLILVERANRRSRYLICVLAPISICFVVCEFDNEWYCVRRRRWATRSTWTRCGCRSRTRRTSTTRWWPPLRTSPRPNDARLSLSSASAFGTLLCSK